MDEGGDFHNHPFTATLYQVSSATFSFSAPHEHSYQQKEFLFESEAINNLRYG